MLAILSHFIAILFRLKCQVCKTPPFRYTEQVVLWLGGKRMKSPVLAEKPSVAREIARVLGCREQHKHYFEAEICRHMGARAFN